MKKIIFSILLVAMFFTATPALAFQNDGVLNTQYVRALETLINLLIKQITLLQQQIVEIKAQEARDETKVEIRIEAPRVKPQLVDLPKEEEKPKWKPCFGMEVWNGDLGECIYDSSKRHGRGYVAPNTR